MTKRKNQKQIVETPSDSEGETPSTKTKKTEMTAEEILEPHLQNPSATLAGKSLEEYVKYNGLLHRFNDKRIGIEEIVNDDDNMAENNTELSDLKEDVKSMNKGLSSVQNELSKISKILTPKVSTQLPIKPNSYAQAVTSTPIPKENFNQNNQLKTIIIKATSNPDIITPTIIDVKVKKIINESKTAAKIVNMKTTKASAYTPKKKDPTIVIKGVYMDNNITNIISQIQNNNSELENITDLENKIKFLFQMKKRNPKFMDLVFRVSPEIFQIINQKMFNNIYIDFQYCKVEHKVLVNQCYKCYEFGHKKSECKKSPICRNCSEPWNANHQCKDINQKCCNNCKNHNLYKNDSNHCSNWENCPLYIAQMKRVIEQTQFYPAN
ncbi:hypothetical protein SSS_02404 [Sarcoptes scabiei]|uniref:CCHC-type domain-containing protein n=1 Tax=Sarcoptes scabiei TaxID=52283 RepID=A0A834RHK2_SARSC|nr:hypothetical protein SSS_02404 [Sarcoptes scabiei]